ncbi:MAG: BrnA antitoxin family protein [Gemmatimonadales bacterium]
MRKVRRSVVGATSGRVDRARLDAMTDAEIEAVRDPEIPNDIDWSTVRVVDPTKAISIRLAQDTLAWYKERAGARGYQRLMKRVLEVYREQVSKR